MDHSSPDAERDPAPNPAPGPTSTPASGVPAHDRWTGSLFHWWFRDRATGKTTVAQFPNLPLWIFVVSVALRRVVSAGTAAHTAIDFIGVGALAWWALDEVLRGVNPWRRLLGLAGCTFAAAGAASLLR
jgi:hypothetical protein